MAFKKINIWKELKQMKWTGAAAAGTANSAASEKLKKQKGIAKRKPASGNWRDN